MSTFNTRCPACQGVNRVPSERVSESPTCGKCKAPLLDGAPVEGTSVNFSTLLNSNQPVVVDFWQHGVIHVSALHRYLVMLPLNETAMCAL